MLKKIAMPYFIFPKDFQLFSYLNNFLRLIPIQAEILPLQLIFSGGFKMKQFFLIALVCVLTLGLCACGMGGDSQSTTSATTVPTTTAPAPSSVVTMPTIGSNIPDPSVDTSTSGMEDTMPTDSANGGDSSNNGSSNGNGGSNGSGNGGSSSNGSTNGNGSTTGQGAGSSAGGSGSH